MDLTTFRDICVEASRQAVRQPGRIGNLVLSLDIRDETLIREPEMIHAFARTLDEKGHLYGIEVPTGGRYRFVDRVGERTMRARHDLAIFAGPVPEVLIELKRGQPAAKGEDFPAISKDLEKLLLEKAVGKAMFHICHASDAATLPAVVSKYVRSFASVMGSGDVKEVERASIDSWFAFYILVLYDRNDEKKAVLRHFEAPTLAELRAAMPELTIEKFGRIVIPRNA